MIEVPIVLDERLVQAGIEQYLSLPLSSGSFLTFGPSNSGKTVLNKLIIGRITLTVPDATATICDGKAFDYAFIRDISNSRHFEYLGVCEGLSWFYREIFEPRLKGKSNDRSFQLIVLEEWSSFMRIQEEVNKPAAKTALSQLFSIVSQGRAYNCRALISCQRPDAAYTGGFRESLTSVIGLGRISTESAKMVGFNEFPEFNGISGGQGVGYMLTETGVLNKVRVPRINNFDRLHQTIIDAVTR